MKVVGNIDHRLASMLRSSFEGLELCDGKLSRTVLKGVGAGINPRVAGLDIKLVQ